MGRAVIARLILFERGDKMKMTLYRYDGERNRVDKRSRMTGATETIDFNYVYESFDPAETDLKLKTNPTMSNVEIGRASCRERV